MANDESSSGIHDNNPGVSGDPETIGFEKGVDIESLFGNPIVSIGNSIPNPKGIPIIGDKWSLANYAEMPVITYRDIQSGKNEIESEIKLFSENERPTGKSCLYFFMAAAPEPNADLKANKPPFVDEANWAYDYEGKGDTDDDDYRSILSQGASPSGFVPSGKMPIIIPKVIIPTTEITANGSTGTNKKKAVFLQKVSLGEENPQNSEAFNWILEKVQTARLSKYFDWDKNNKVTSLNTKDMQSCITITQGNESNDDKQKATYSSLTVSISNIENSQRPKTDASNSSTDASNSSTAEANPVLLKDWRFYSYRFLLKLKKTPCPEWLKNEISDDDWDNMVCHGAFCISFKMEDTVPSCVPEKELHNVAPEVIAPLVMITFGEVQIKVDQKGSASVSIGYKTKQPNVTKVSLFESRTSEKPITQEKNAKTTKYDKVYNLVVIPVWNGIVIQNGVTDGDKESANIASTFCQKTRGKTPFDEKGKKQYQEEEFNPFEPKPVRVLYEHPKNLEPNSKTVNENNEEISDVFVDLGDEITVDIRNCKVTHLKYTPCFFTKRCSFDLVTIVDRPDESDKGTEISVENIQTKKYTRMFEKYIYPVWCDGSNRSSDVKVNKVSIRKPTKSDENNEEESYSLPEYLKAIPLPEEFYGGPIYYPKNEETDPQEFYYWHFEMTTEKWSRNGPMLFTGYIHDRETIDKDNTNPNGNFHLEVSQNSRPGCMVSYPWQSFIQNVSVSHSQEGSSAQIVVDKYGFAGWDADVEQCIGAITIDVSMKGYHGGRIFSGVTQSINTSDGPDSNTWTINCVGLEKKLQDIILMAPPFFDHDEIGNVLDYLTLTGGVYYDLYFGTDPDVEEDSEDPEVKTWTRKKSVGGSVEPWNQKFNFPTGTSILDALRKLEKDGPSISCVFGTDGRLRVHQLSAKTSLPLIMVEPDCSSDYPYCKVSTRNLNPDLESIRNQVLIVALQQMPSVDEVSVANLPAALHTKFCAIDTNPVIPWDKPAMEEKNGFLDDKEMQRVMENTVRDMSKYDLTGGTTIPGDARIQVYSKWGNYCVSGVSHNIDLTSKTWTTSLELQRTAKNDE